MNAHDPQVRTIPNTVVAGWPTSPIPRAVIDVRERGEYILGHIPGSTNIPRGLLEIRLPSLIPVRSIPMAFYCDDAYRSSLAAACAARLGYTDVHVVEGGLAAWANDGLNVAYGVNVIGKDYGERIAVEHQVPQITPEELGDLQSRKRVMVLDVRTPHEFELEGHLAGAHNVPGGELPVAALAQAMGPTPPDAIVVNCAGRTRSIVAADLLASLGLNNVMALTNGTMAWIMAGKELETGPDTNPLPIPGEPARRRSRELARSLTQGLEIPAIDSEALAAAVDGEELVYVLDVRTPAEFEEERIAGAVLCPAGQLTNYLDDRVHVRQALIVCYSSGDTRAAFAARTLAGIGYPNVRWLQGGLDAFRAYGLTVTGPGLSVGQSPCTRDGVETISAHTLATDQADPVRRIIDIRQSSDFMSGHVPSSTWVPRGDLERRIGRFVSTSQEVVIASDDSRLAGLAAGTLRELGYAMTRVLEGGPAAWKSAGYTLVEGADGSDINLLAAREEADLVGFGPQELRRTHEDMVRYLVWEEQLGDKYSKVSP